MGEEGEEEEEEGHLVWRVHKRLAVLSHKICWKGCVSQSPWLELVSCIACGKCGEGALAFKKDPSSSKQTTGQNQETGFCKHDGTLMTNSLDSLLLEPKFHHQLWNNLFQPPHIYWVLSNISASLTNQYTIPPPALCSLSVWHNWGLAPTTNHTATTQQLLVDLACCQTHITPTAISSLGTQRDTQLVPKDQNKLGSCPKESKEGPLLAQYARMCVRLYTLIHLRFICNLYLMWHPWPSGPSQILCLLRQSGNLAFKCRMTTQPANWKPFSLWGHRVCLCSCFFVCMCWFV